MIDLTQIDAAIRYHLSLHANITALWGIYIAATFTGAAFSITETFLSVASLVAVTVGFWVFAFGHAAMLWIAIRNTIQIQRFLDQHEAGVLQVLPIALGISRRRYSLLWSLSCHGAIDICVTVLIWRSHLF